MEKKVSFKEGLDCNVSSISPGEYVIVILHQDGKVSNYFFIKKNS